MPGCATIGSGHSWRSERTNNLGKAKAYSDHNWPKVAVDPHHPTLPASHLPGGDHRHDRLLRCPVDKLPQHPASHLTVQPNYSLTRERRWWGCKDNGELDRHFQQNRMPPGPGAYFKSAPRGPHFPVDSGETVVIGANHPCPWKSPLGQAINPTNIHALSEHHSAPKWTMSKTRRGCSETSLGHGQQAGGPIKSDEGCLSPGHVYTMYSTFSEGPGLKGKRRARSTPSLGGRMRVQPVPPEPEPGAAGAHGDDEFGSPLDF
jgi:hypothetical protein